MLNQNQLAAVLGVKPGELERAIEGGAIVLDATRPSRKSGRASGRFLFVPERLEEHRAAMQASVESGKAVQAAQAAQAGRGLVDAGQLARRLGAEVRQVLDTLRRSGVRRDGSRVRRLPVRTQRLPAFVPERVPEIEGILRHHF
jgi:hypothetical protein